MVRTSITHPLRIDDLPLGNGRLGITFCPGKKGDSVFGVAWDRDLDLNLNSIKVWGASAVLTLIADRELERLDVAKRGEAAPSAAEPDHDIYSWAPNNLSCIRASTTTCKIQDDPPCSGRSFGNEARGLLAKPQQKTDDNMIKISLVGQTKVSTLQKRFKNEFGLTLRIYDGRSFADPASTIGKIRKKQGAPEIGIRRNIKIGNLESKFMDEAGIKVQIAGSDDSYLCDNDLTLAAALTEDQRKLGRKEAKSAVSTAQDSDHEHEAGDNNEANEFLINAAWEDRGDRNICRWMVVWKIASESSIAGVLAGYSGGGTFQLEQFVAYFSGRKLSSLMIDTEDKITGDELDFFDDVPSELLEICDDAQDVVLEWNNPDEWEDAEQLLLQDDRAAFLIRKDDLLILEKGSSIFLKEILENVGITAAPAVDFK